MYTDMYNCREFTDRVSFFHERTIVLYPRNSEIQLAGCLTIKNGEVYGVCFRCQRRRNFPADSNVERQLQKLSILIGSSDKNSG